MPEHLLAELGIEDAAIHMAKLLEVPVVSQFRLDATSCERNSAKRNLEILDAQVSKTSACPADEATDRKNG